MTASAFDLQGHRGARGLAPENTLIGFAKALSIGVSTLELDTAITRDGVVVISHDPRLNPDITRDARGNWITPPFLPISTLAYADLQRYDVGRIKPGTNYAQRYPFQRGRDKTRIPRLSDLFALAQKLGAHDVRFNIETKIFPDEPALTVGAEEFARALIAEIHAAGVTARSTIQSFDWRTLAVVQREAPQIATAYLTAQQPWMDNIRADKGGESPWTAGVQFAKEKSIPRMVHAAGGRIWSPHYADLTRVDLSEARQLGLKTIPWTVNTRPDIERLIDWGVDGLISDYPDLLRTIALEKKLSAPLPVRVTPVKKSGASAKGAAARLAK